MRKEIFDGYLADENGYVISLKRKERKLTGQLNWAGYPMVCLMIGSKQRLIAVHRLIAKAFIPNPLGLPEVNHINGIKSDNRVENLEWISKSDNHKHAHKIGLKNHKADKSHYKKLEWIDVEIIREALSLGVTGKVIAKHYNISCSNVSHIKNRDSWQ